MRFEYGFSKENKTTLIFEGFEYTKKTDNQNKCSEDSAVKQLHSPEEMSSSNFPEKLLSISSRVSGAASHKNYGPYEGAFAIYRQNYRQSDDFSEYLWKQLASITKADQFFITRTLSLYHQKK